MSIKPSPYVFGPGVLTVIIRDDSPMIHCGDSPAYRSVRIALTDDQIAQMKLAHTYTSGGVSYYEQVSKCFVETPRDQIEATP